MMTPPLERLLSKAESKYSLVVAAAKRGRQLMEGYPKLIESPSHKPVTIALEEISAGRVKLEPPRVTPR